MWSPTGLPVISADLNLDYPGFGFTWHGSKIELNDSSNLNRSDPFSDNQNLDQMLAITLAGLIREASAGWPLRCLKYVNDPGPVPSVGAIFLNEPEIKEDTILTSLWRNGIAIPPSFEPFDSPPRDQLPIRPIWPGFAINTIIYAVVLWILWSTPFAARRLIRRKRGLCIKCGYDLRGTSGGVCPECGQILTCSG